VRPLLGPHFDPVRFGQEEVKHDTVGAEAWPPPLPVYLPWLEMLQSGPQHLTGLVVKRHIEVRLGGIAGIHSRRDPLPWGPPEAATIDFSHESEN
jgi:hypothetical protein